MIKAKKKFFLKLGKSSSALCYSMTPCQQDNILVSDLFF